MATVATLPRSRDYLSLRLDHGAGVLHEPGNTSTNNGALYGFPQRYTGERVWTGSEMLCKEDEWLTVLSEEDHEHITKALRHFQDLKLDPQGMSRESFPLPIDLQQRLKALAHDCYSGRGFAVLRGLRSEDFTEAENVLIFGGIASHVAPVRGFQDLKRETVTCHVISEESRPGAENQALKPAFTNGRLAFHTDIGDILSLYTIETAGQGGKTTIVSSSTLYNMLAEDRPDLLEELGEPWVYFATQDYTAEGAPLVTNLEGDKLVFQFSRLPVTGYGQHGPNATIPSPTARRLEAISMIEELAWEHCFQLPGKRGDIAFINNLTVMHARSAFDLDAEGKPLPSKRHLVKLMLQDPELTWGLPGALAGISNRVYGPNRPEGGRDEKWQLTVDSNDDLSGGHVWAGNGGMSNG